MKIGLLSDTHSYFDPKIAHYFSDCDEIWHAGDIGDYKVVEELQALKPFRAVYGNIDDAAIRRTFPEILNFTIAGLRVSMIHIGGYPGGYTAKARKMLEEAQPDLYICGHSHILKVMPDRKRNLLHINPGACGHHGFHQVRTLVRFSILNGIIDNLEVIELGARGKI